MGARGLCALVMAALFAAPAGDGRLFSAVMLGRSALADAWTPLRLEAARRFPALGLTHPEDLHVTVVYVGSWKRADLPRLRAAMLVNSAAHERLAPEVVYLGRASQVVAVELKTPSAAWSSAVVDARRELATLSLRRAEDIDADFRPHVTLATAPHTPPTDDERAQLAAFHAWITAEVARNPVSFTVDLGPGRPVGLFLAATRPAADGPEFVPVED